MARDDLRLLAKVADLYYRRGHKQAAISKQLGLHQSSISRLIKRAEEQGIVRVSLNYPVGFYPELEASLEDTFGLTQAIVVDGARTEAELVAHLGSATAFLVESTLRASDIVGISSWSSCLLAMVNSMRAGEAKAASVVQILGGLGQHSAEAHATRLTQRLAHLLNADPVLLMAPGVVRSKQSRNVLLEEPYVQQALRLFDKVSVALVGIGAVEPSPLLADSGNAFDESELKELRAAGAVGDICMCFFDKQGRPVKSRLNEQVVGMSLAQLKRVDRVVGVAGGRRKIDAIRAALRGGWIDVLITDETVAKAIANDVKAVTK